MGVGAKGLVPLGGGCWPARRILPDVVVLDIGLPRQLLTRRPGWTHWKPATWM